MQEHRNWEKANHDDERLYIKSGTILQEAFAFLRVQELPVAPTLRLWSVRYNVASAQLEQQELPHT